MDDMKNAVLYVHGKGGSAAECERYRPLFPDCRVFGLDYQTFTPWETGAEIRAAAEKLKTEYENIILIANSKAQCLSYRDGRRRALVPHGEANEVFGRLDQKKSSEV